MNDSEIEVLAKMTYGAYGSVTDHKNYQGLPMPTWENLTDKIREAWKAAAAYAFKQGVGSVTIPKSETPDHR